MLRMISTRPPDSNSAPPRDEEAQQRPTETMNMGETRADTLSSPNDIPDAKGINKQNNHGSSNALYPLLKEATDDKDVIRKLDSNREDLKTLVNIPFPKEYCKTSLHLAAEKGYRSVVKKLLEKGAADSSLGDEDGWRPLYFACGAGHKEVIDELLDHEADSNLTDNLGCNPLHIACIYRQTATFKHVLERYPRFLQQSTTIADLTSLHLAILFGDESMVMTCLDSGADIYAKDGEGQTTLMVAAYAKDKGKMDTLMKRLKSADSDLTVHVNACNNEGKTPLMVACERGWAQGVECLDQAGAKYDSTDCLGRPALHYALEGVDLSVIETTMKKTDLEHLLMADAGVGCQRNKATKNISNADRKSNKKGYIQ